MHPLVEELLAELPDIAERAAKQKKPDWEIDWRWKAPAGNSKRGGAQTRKVWRQLVTDAAKTESAEIKEVVKDQLEDDVTSIVGNGIIRVGRTRAEHRNDHWHDDQYPVWARRTPDQLAMQEGMAPFLERLKPEQHQLLMLRYGDERLTELQIVKLLGKPKTTIHRHIQKAVDQLAAMLREAFVPVPIEPEPEPPSPWSTWEVKAKRGYRLKRYEELAVFNEQLAQSRRLRERRAKDQLEKEKWWAGR